MDEYVITVKSIDAQFSVSGWQDIKGDDRPTDEEIKKYMKEAKGKVFFRAHILDSHNQTHTIEGPWVDKDAIAFPLGEILVAAAKSIETHEKSVAEKKELTKTSRRDCLPVFDAR